MPTAPTAPAAGYLTSLAGLCRPHIVAIAGLAAVVFGWFFGGRLSAAAGLVAALDWFLLNLWNRLADVPEDRRNGVAGVEWAARHGPAIGFSALAVFAASLLATFRFGPWLLGLRLAFQMGGFAYSFSIFGVKRLKDRVGVKNVASAVLFLISVFGYPLAIGHDPFPRPIELAFLAAFFVPFEITYELIYDLRDVEGDLAAGLWTVPILLGDEGTRGLIRGLLWACALALVAGFATGSLRFAELAMIAAPIQQAILLRWPLGRVTAKGAVFATWMGAGQLATFILWVAAGLPLGPGR